MSSKLHNKDKLNKELEYEIKIEEQILKVPLKNLTLKQLLSLEKGHSFKCTLTLNSSEELKICESKLADKIMLI